MRVRGLLTALAAMLLLAGMFVAVHRGARGHGIAERITGIDEEIEAAGERRSELQKRIELLRSRPRVTRAAERLGMHVPSGEELVILDLRGQAWQSPGGAW